MNGEACNARPEPWHLRIAPRRWQGEALDLWRHNRRGVVSVVTGGGKTAFAEMCMATFRRETPTGRFVILVPTTVLLDQWFLSLIEDLGVPEAEVACFSGESKPPKPAALNLLIINTARDHVVPLARGLPTMLIVDECHRAGSPSNARALHGTFAATLGLSATPERDYDDGFEKFVAPVLGEVIYTYDYANAYADGVITPFDLVNVKVELLPDEEARYDRLTKRAAVEVRRIRSQKGGSEERLKFILHQRAAVSKHATMRIPVAAKLVDQHRGQRTLVFHEQIVAATTLFRVLSERHHSVTIYHSRINSAFRRDNLKLYRRGMFDVLVSCRALDEGMNIPETRVAVIASSTASYRQRIQRLGRVLRPSPGKTAAQVYTIYATRQEELRLELEATRLEGLVSVRWLHGGRRRGG